jgi:hypothetical protein
MTKSTLLELIASKWQSVFGDTAAVARRMIHEFVPPAESPKMVWNFDTPEFNKKAVSR